MSILVIVRSKVCLRHCKVDQDVIYSIESETLFPSHPHSHTLAYQATLRRPRWPISSVNPLLMPSGRGLGM